MAPGNTGSWVWVCILKVFWREGHLATAELLSQVTLPQSTSCAPEEPVRLTSPSPATSLPTGTLPAGRARPPGAFILPRVTGVSRARVDFSKLHPISECLSVYRLLILFLTGHLLLIGCQAVCQTAL